MILDPYRLAVMADIVVVQSFKQNVIGESLAVPPHQAGDLIVLVAKFTSVPSLVSGWTNILTQNNNFGNDIRVSYVIDTAGTIATVISGSATLQMSATIYRNASGIGSILSAAESGPRISVTTPALTLASARSRVHTGISSNQGGDASDPAAHTRLFDNLAPPLGGGTHWAWDVFPGSTSYGGGTAGAMTNGFQSEWSIEILPL